MQEEMKTSENLVKKLLAEHIGVEPEDINETDSLTEDLHMSSADLSDFVSSLEVKGIDTTPLDLPNIETVGDLIEALTSEELIE